MHKMLLRKQQKQLSLDDRRRLWLKLSVNGKTVETDAANIMALWREETADLELESSKGYAISLNGKVVRKTQWDLTPVAENDQVEIVRAMQGG